MTGTHSPADWAAFLSLGTSAYAAVSVPFFLLVDADLADFDPRPALSRLVESGRLDPLLVAVVNAKADAREIAADARHFTVLHLRDAAISAAALLALLLPAAGGPR
ncbi:hypothetical protein [Streptomyces sp. NPDC002573]|uniref:hypothetical protein n=1 Tax=Streptomyces sp. NPDC002573 TaxID=3364651 RepID=UPI003698467E